MDIGKITEKMLLDNPAIESVDFEYQNYFSRNDLDKAFLGSFHHIDAIILPLKTPNGTRTLTACISWENISKHITQMAGKTEFEQRINTALNFNPKRK